MSLTDWLTGYLNRLDAIGAPVLENLLPAAEDAEIQKLAQDTGVEIPPSLQKYWRRIGGIRDELTYHEAAFAGYLFAPVSVEEALAEHRVWQRLRLENPMDDQAFADEFWPEGLLKFAGEDTNGFWIDCRPASPTYGAVYVRFANSEPMLKWSASLDALFETLSKAIDEGIIKVAEDDNPDWDVGALSSDEDALDLLAKKMNPGCAAHEQSF